MSNYKAGQIRDIAELKEVIERVNNEFKALESAFEQPLRLPVLSAEPARPRDGTVAYADGIAWDPTGEGQGYYAYFDGEWHKLIDDTSGIENDIAVIEGDIVDIQGDIAAIEADITAIEADITALEAAAAFGKAPDVIIEDQKANNVDGGTATSGSWQTRTLNTLVRNQGTLASLSSDQFTLPAGTYYIQFSAPAYVCNAHKCRLYNFTDAVVVEYGTSQASGIPSVGGMANSVSAGSAVVTIAGSKAFKIEHRVGTTRSTDGYGVGSNFTTIETYTRVEITRLA